MSGYLGIQRRDGQFLDNVSSQNPFRAIRLVIKVDEALPNELETLSV